MESIKPQAKTSAEEKLRRYCQWTSLHGFNFLTFPSQTFTQTLFWILIIVASITGAFFVVSANIKDFAESSVSYDLETPLQPLNDVFFPSLVLCNMNQLRSSFVWAVVNDLTMEMENITYVEVHQLLEKTFVKGQDLELSQTEMDLINAVLNTSTYDNLFDEILKVGLGEKTNDTEANAPLFHHHRVQYLDMDNLDREKVKRELFLNIAAQFRYGEMISRVNFAGFGVLIDLAFSSDVSDTCSWMTPLVLEPDEISFTGVKKFARNGINNGLQLLLDAENYDYASPIKSKAGFMFTVLHQLDIAILKQTGSIAMPGQSVQVAITPTLTDTIPSAKIRFNPIDRQCYFDNEINLEHLPSFGYRYEMSNCLFEASLQKIGRECGCTPSFFAAFISDPYPACEGQKKLCMDKFMEDIGTERYVLDKGKKKECLATCQDQTHQFLVTSSAYPNQQSFHLGEDFCLILKKLRLSCSNEKRYTLDLQYPELCVGIESTMNESCDSVRGLQVLPTANETELMLLRKQIAKYSAENLVVLDVYIRDPYVKLYMRREKITIVSFIGNIGGLLGLFLGFSFISVIEVFYMFGLSSNSSSSQNDPARKGRKREKNKKSKNGIFPMVY